MGAYRSAMPSFFDAASFLIEGVLVSKLSSLTLQRRGPNRLQGTRQNFVDKDRS